MLGTEYFTDLTDSLSFSTFSHLSYTRLALLTLALIFLSHHFIFRRNSSSKSKKLLQIPDELIFQRLSQFKPDPLTPHVDKPVVQTITTSAPGRWIEVMLGGAGSGGQKVRMLNFTTSDFLDFGHEESVTKVAEDTMNKYGCGSCGPRGFYGTFDVHLDLEEAIAKFFKAEDSIVYSDSFTTTASVIAAFSSRKDLLVVDSGCSERVLNGCYLSRATVVTFKHNDVKSLEETLQNLASSKNKYGRKIIIIEGLYKRTGDIAPLREILALKKRFKYRLLIDETLSFGVLGETGRGVCEQTGVSMSEVEFVVGSLDTVCGSIGGFCVGSKVVTEHQRLMGAGYCFSASTPPFLCAVAQESLRLLDSNTGKERISDLHKISKLLDEEIKGAAADCLYTTSSDISPVKVLYVKGKNILTEDLEKVKLECERLGVLVSVPKESTLGKFNGDDRSELVGIKIEVCVYHRNEDIKKVVQTLVKAVKNIL